MNQKQKIQTIKVNTLATQKEQNVLHDEDNRFWKALSKKALLNAWEKEDEIWNKKVADYLL